MKIILFCRQGDLKLLSLVFENLRCQPSEHQKQRVYNAELKGSLMPKNIPKKRFVILIIFVIGCRTCCHTWTMDGKWTRPS